ncbi:sodium:proton antiporter [Lentzea sp. NBRC 105346]|uniref:cation:proton antiporter n=1 Tax=Lentzea sp. NBRC 105346 TaxID=3032205 RepID=UPI0024A59558|nr:cation:proton antiporter [Lentzea sp. NBRC 105346]GLZ32012.1 sodium:proton antiporter [Lentzea sp. NBRC 105346]
MPDVEFVNLLIVAAIAVTAPLLLGFAPRLRVPAVVLEIVAGIVVGPSGLGWVEIDLPVQIVALLGLAFLLFLAGLEFDPRRLRGPTTWLALLGYVISVGVGLAIGLGFGAAGWVRDPLLLAVALSATSLGLVVAVLKDAGRLDGAAGQSTITAASVADFAAIVLLSLVFSTTGGTVTGRVGSLAVFAGLVVVTGLVIAFAGRSRRLGDVLSRLQDTTAEIRVRTAVVLLVAFVALAEQFGLETILGAFLAGVVVSVVDRDTSSHPRFRIKLEAIGYGFLIPVFFITSGMRLDLSGLLAEPAALARVPLFLIALLLARGVPALVFARALGWREVAAVGLLQATSLPFIVTATQIGVVLGAMSPVTAAALVCAGLLSVLLFPVSAVGLLPSRDRDQTNDGARRVATGPTVGD